jgi:demethylmenaquinone methyltransferase/2-methoxy-6-polyprenyl-1,4-benzoquinol methylase
MNREKAKPCSNGPNSCRSAHNRMVEQMFDRIAPRYDLLNRLLSLRRDAAWRRALVRRLPDRSAMRVLDLATGTGDVLEAAIKVRPSLRLAAGLDPAAHMLSAAARKMNAKTGKAALIRGDAMRMPFAQDAFDAVTIAFGVRNLPDMHDALREMHRVLKPGAVCLILEFSLPRNPLLRAVYLAYFRAALPRIGGLVSGDREAYRYLNQTVESFPYGSAFIRAMEAAGFKKAAAAELTFGIATLYQGVK